MDIYEINKIKVGTRNLIDVTLLSICMTAFVLVATLNPAILAKNYLFTLQLVLAIPLFVCTLLARIKAAYKSDYKPWDNLGFISFTLAYGFFINVVGILLSLFTALSIVLVFFSVNIILDLIRTGIQIHQYQTRSSRPIFRIILHLLIIILLGILPACKIY